MPADGLANAARVPHLAQTTNPVTYRINERPAFIARRSDSSAQRKDFLGDLALAGATFLGDDLSRLCLLFRLASEAQETRNAALRRDVGKVAAAENGDHGT